MLLPSFFNACHVHRKTHATHAIFASAHKRNTKIGSTDTISNPNKKGKVLNKQIKHKIVDETDVLIYDEKRLVMPKPLKRNILGWYHHYLQHPGETCLEGTLTAVVYWPGLRAQVCKYMKTANTAKKVSNASKSIDNFQPRYP